MTILRDFAEKGIFPFYEGNSRDFEGGGASAKILTTMNFCSYILKVLTEMLLLCKIQVFWTIFWVI